MSKNSDAWFLAQAEEVKRTERFRQLVARFRKGSGVSRETAEQWAKVAMRHRKKPPKPKPSRRKRRRP